MLERQPRLALLAGLVLAIAPAAHAAGPALGSGYVLSKRSVTARIHKTSYGRGPIKPLILSGACALHLRCSPGRFWVPGHYVTRQQKVWIPASKKKVWIDPVYETRYDACGRPYQVRSRGGGWTVQVTPGHFETRCTKVWVPGVYQARCATY